MQDLWPTSLIQKNANATTTTNNNKPHITKLYSIFDKGNDILAE